MKSEVPNQFPHLTIKLGYTSWVYLNVQSLEARTLLTFNEKALLSKDLQW